MLWSVALYVAVTRTLAAEDKDAELQRERELSSCLNYA